MASRKERSGYLHKPQFPVMNERQTELIKRGLALFKRIDAVVAELRGILQAFSEHCEIAHPAMMDEDED